MIPVVVVTAALAGSGGVVFGALARQPEINKLKAQVERLQEELLRMQQIVSDVMKDNEILQLKMQLAQNEDILNDLRTAAIGQGEQEIGKLIYGYGLKEYLEIKQKFLMLNQDITQEEAVYVDAFALFLENRIPEGESGSTQKRYIKEYLTEKYAKEIEEMLPPDLEKVMQILEKKMEEYHRKEEEEQAKMYQGEIIPELACLTLDPAQTRLLYSLQKHRTLYDISQTKEADKRRLKTLWLQEWKARILESLNADERFLIGEEDFLYQQIQDAHAKSVSKTWLYLVALELLLFTPYTPLGGGKDLNKLWKGCKAKSDYMNDVFCVKQDVVDKALLKKMAKTYDAYVSKLTGRTGKALAGVAVTAVAAVATAGLASVFAPTIAVTLAGGHLVGLSGAALTHASLALLGGGAVAAGGFGMAGGVAVITGGGALLGMAGGTATVAAMSLLSTEGYALHESAKLLTFCKTVLLEQTASGTQIVVLQKTVAQRIRQFGGELALRKAASKQDKKAIPAIEKNMRYLEKCNKELLSIISKQDRVI